MRCGGSPSFIDADHELAGPGLVRGLGAMNALAEAS